MDNTVDLNSKPNSALLLYSLLGIGAVLLLLVIVGTGVGIMSGAGKDGLAWMIVAGGGFITIVSVMILGAFIYRATSMHDESQALGMPKGSVRSLLMFLVFTLLGVFVFFSVDSIGDQTIRSTLVVPETDAQAWMDDLGDNTELIGVRPGDMLERTVDGETVLVPTTEITFDRIRPASDAVTDHINQIAIAIFSMASSIIGYYFGTRSQVPAAGQENANSAGSDAPAPTAPQAASDSPDWSLGAGQITLTKGDGGHFGEISVSSEELDGDHAFAGMVVPPEDDREKYAGFDVTVTRNGATLSVQITGPDEPSLIGAQLSLYPIDHDDVAIAVDIA